LQFAVYKTGASRSLTAAARETTCGFANIVKWSPGTGVTENRPRIQRPQPQSAGIK
jgi:hypothetical protein